MPSKKVGGLRASGKKGFVLKTGLPLMIVFSVVTLRPAVAAQSAKEPAESACRPAKIRDYAQPLRELPNIRRAHASAPLGAGPPQLRLAAPEELVVGSSDAGFTLSALSGHHRYRLGWHAVIRAFRPRGTGGKERVSDERHIHLDRPTDFNDDPVRIALRLPSKPAIYRLELQIRDRNGTTVGTYSEYVRVLQRRVDVKLLPGSPVYQAGDIVATRLENRGTLSVEFGQRKVLEQRKQDAWVPVPVEPTVLAPYAAEIGPGETGPCEAYDLPRGLVAGTYRLSKTVTSGSRRLLVSALFQIG